MSIKKYRPTFYIWLAMLQNIGYNEDKKYAAILNI